MGLTEKEKKLMEKLQKKAEEPDRPSVGRSVTANVDLKDPESVRLAIKHGFLDPDEDDDDDGDDDADDDGDDTPKRRGYFPSDKKK